MESTGEKTIEILTVLFYTILEKGIQSLLTTSKCGQKIVRIPTIVSLLTDRKVLITEDLIKLGSYIIQKFRKKDPQRTFLKVVVDGISNPIIMYTTGDILDLCKYCHRWLGKQKYVLIKENKVLSLLDITKKVELRKYPSTLVIPLSIYNDLIKVESGFYQKNTYYLDIQAIISTATNGGSLSGASLKQLNGYIFRQLKDCECCELFPFYHFSVIVPLCHRWIGFNGRKVRYRKHVLGE
jgi:hypothetical protein